MHQAGTLRNTLNNIFITLIEKSVFVAISNKFMPIVSLLPSF